MQKDSNRIQGIKTAVDYISTNPFFLISCKARPLGSILHRKVRVSISKCRLFLWLNENCRTCNHSTWSRSGWLKSLKTPHRSLCWCPDQKTKQLLVQNNKRNRLITDLYVKTDFDPGLAGRGDLFVVVGREKKLGNLFQWRLISRVFL